VKRKDLSDNHGTCTVCARIVRVCVPRGGDGSARVCYTHDDVGMRCAGSRQVCAEDYRRANGTRLDIRVTS
jgi:hypothetical protein